MLDWIKNLLTEPDEVYDLSPVYDIISAKDGEWWKVFAVKKCREITGLGLRESKSIVEELIEEGE